MLRKIMFIFLYFFLTPLFAYQGYEPIQHIKTVANDFVMSQVIPQNDEKIEIVTHVDDMKTKLAMCDQPLTAGFPGSSNKDHFTSVEVSCQDARHAWHIFVPVDLQVYTDVIGLKRDVNAKDVLTDDDIEMLRADKMHLYNGFFKDKNDVIGLEATQYMRSGTLLNKKNIQSPIIVHRNDMVELTARKNSLSVTMRGIAKSDGRMHDMVKAYNPSSKRTVDAIVVGQGKVEITL